MELAIQALGFLAEDPERLSRFLALTGISLQSLRATAREPGFLGAVLAYVAGDAKLAQAFAAERGTDEARIQVAHTALTGPSWEPDTA